MPQPKHKGETTIELNGITYPLRYKTKNMMVLSEMTGKSPIAFFSVFEGLSETEQEETAKQVCNHALVVPLLVAGLANHPNFKRSAISDAEDKVCDLIDAEVERSGKAGLQVIAEIAAVVVPAALNSFAIKDPGGKGNGEPPADGAAQE